MSRHADVPRATQPHGAALSTSLFLVCIYLSAQRRRRGALRKTSIVFESIIISSSRARYHIYIRVVTDSHPHRELNISLFPPSLALFLFNVQAGNQLLYVYSRMQFIQPRYGTDDFNFDSNKRSARSRCIYTHI